jgi:hypothetical protein
MTPLSMFRDRLHRASISRSDSVITRRCQLRKCVCERTVTVLGRMLVSLRCDRTLMASTVHQLGQGCSSGSGPGKASMSQVVETQVVSPDGGRTRF